MKTLFVTTVGGRVGHGILDVIAPWRHLIRVVGANSIADAAANFRCDTAYLAPGTSDLPGWLARMREILRRERPDVVVAGRDEDLRPLAMLKGEAEFAGTQFLCPGPETARIVTDKYETYSFAMARGLPFVRTAVTAGEVEALIAAEGFPIIAKPRAGSGAYGVRALSSRTEVATWLKRGGVVFQAFIDPPDSLDDGALDPALGVPLVFAAGWRIFCSVTATVEPDRRVSYLGASLFTYHGADTTHQSRVDDADNEHVALGFARALAALDYVGLLNIQGRRGRDGRFVPFELNGRITGGVTSRILQGIDDLKTMLDILVGPRKPAETAESVGNASIWRTMRWDRIDRSMIAELDRNGVWQAAERSRADPPRGP